MKKQIVILITLMLLCTVVIAACGKSGPTEEPNTVNLPVVDVGDDGSTATDVAQTNPTEASVSTNQESYPIEQDPSVTTFDPAVAYPIDSTSPNYDAEMEAYLTSLLGEKHDLQFLLEKDLTAEQWREILTDADHTHLQLSEGSMEAIINWLISK